ncbi:Calx-beta domain-containing protein, partial [Spongiivirga sp. MCCC 1A20706]|uniref:beta strand repeat-containing protein n=1 Tax=Spongiivirga sp. MCCC 1A20706 TaxID=3160963 RepID=UPI0039773033
NGLVTITDSQGEGTITDNDAASIAIDDVTVNEAAGTATLTVTLTGDVQGGFSVDYATSNNTAVQPGDYTSSTGTLTFAGTDTETETFTVPIIDDNILEATESLFADLSGITNTLVTITDSQGEITITDNDTANVSIDDVTVNEVDGTATLTVTLTGNVQSAFDISFASADNSATQPSDYTAVSGTLSFAGNDTETQTVTISIINDTTVENDESFFINLSGITNGLVTVADSQGEVTIIDNDSFITIGDITVNEGAGNATFNVTLTGNVAGGFTVNYATANDTAIEPGDYTSNSGTLTFVGTDAEVQTITVPIIDDILVEPSEDFFVNLSGISSALVAIADNQAVGSITDNDSANIVINDVTVNEGDGTATFTVTLSAAVAGGFSVDYNTSDDTALQPGDYTTASGTLNFVGTAGEPQTFTVPIIDDGLLEVTETFFANLSNVSSGLVTINDAQGVATITDNDAASLAINDITVNEAAGTATFTVTLTGDVDGSFTVDYASANNTAVSGSDYTAVTNSLTFTGTDAETQTLTVNITDDNLVEASETYFINLSNVSNTLVTISDGQGEGTITDNDSAGIVIADVTVNEAAGTATFTVTLTGDVQGGFTVDYATADGTATQPADYADTTGTLTF